MARPRGYPRRLGAISFSPCGEQETNCPTGEKEELSKNFSHPCRFPHPPFVLNPNSHKTTGTIMTVIAEALPASRPARWVGRILSGLVILFLLFDGAIKLVPWPIVTETMER